MVAHQKMWMHMYTIYTHKCIHIMYIHRYTHVHNVHYTLAQMRTYIHIDVYTQTMDIYMQTYTDVHTEHTQIYIHKYI